MNDSKKRINYVDYFKGLGIILMIMGHIGFGTNFDFFIHAFHMPMFFVISGYLFNNEVPFKIFIKKKFKQLLIPYMFFGMFHLMVYYLIYGSSNLMISLKSLLFINTNNLPIAGALWFLTTLYFANIFYFLISKIKNNIFKFCIVLLISITGVIIPIYTRLPYGIDISLAAIGFMYAGSIIRKYKNNILNSNLIAIILIIVLEFVLININGYVNLRMGQYSNIILTYINAIFASIVILYFSNIFCSFKNSIVRKFNDVLISIGSNSLTYLVLNELIILIINNFLTNTSLPTSISKIINLFLTVILLYIINKLFNTKYLSVLIGKKAINKNGAK